MDREAEPAKVVEPFLMEADIAAVSAVDDRISESFPDPKNQRRVGDYLSNPFFRPLFELLLNGATSLAGARVLLAGEFIETEDYTVRFGHLAGNSMEAVRVTRLGISEFNALCPSIDNDLVFKRVQDAILSYVAINYGAGIVARRHLIDFAIDYEDSEILSHLVGIHTGRRQIESMPFHTIVTEKQRLEDADYWSGVGDDRGGAAFVDLTKRPPRMDGKKST